MDFPRLVFRSPGKTACGRGGKDETYDHVLVENEQEHAAALKAGYFPTLPEALAHPVKFKLEPAPEVKEPEVKEPEHAKLEPETKSGLKVK